MTDPSRVEAALDAVIEGRLSLEDAGALMGPVTPFIDRRAAARENTAKASEERVLALVEREQPPLIEGRMLTCPGCEAQHDVLAYTPLNHSKRYEAQVVVPLVCPSCKHIFALRP